MQWAPGWYNLYSSVTMSVNTSNHSPIAVMSQFDEPTSQSGQLKHLPGREVYCYSHMALMGGYRPVGHGKAVWGPWTVGSPYEIYERAIY